MAKVRSVNFSPDEFLVGVAGLTPEEIGCYWVICSLQYSSGLPIPLSDERLSLMRARSDKVLGLVKSLVKSGKLILEAGCISNRRATSELLKAELRMTYGRLNGKLGGRPSKQNKDLIKGIEKAITTTTTNYNNNHASRGLNGGGKTRNGKNGHTAIGIMATEETRWRARLKSFKKSGAWMVELYGPKPGEPECAAPQGLVSEILG